MTKLPLEDAWKNIIDATLRAHGWPLIGETARLGELVRALSSSYNASGTAARAGDSLAARVAFSFVRDVPKGAAAVRELVEMGALAMPTDRALRVLDYGAGLGATTWGVLRALAAAGGAGAIDALWVDSDAAALAIGEELWRAQKDSGKIELRVKTLLSKAPPLHGTTGGEKFDVILLGQVLSELDAAFEPDARVARHTAMIEALMESSLADDGSLVVIEPALRDRTRHLHAVRDTLLANGSCGVFAPCLHAEKCPALAHEGDWCHEDLAVDLPEWLTPVARAAGLRWQGLTFSYLVLRKDGRTVASSLPAGVRLRVVSGALVSKGKREAFLCGKVGDAPAARVRAQRIDRHESDANRAWSDLERGDLLSFPDGFSGPAPVPPSPFRIRADTKIDVPVAPK